MVFHPSATPGTPPASGTKPVRQESGSDAKRKDPREELDSLEYLMILYAMAGGHKGFSTQQDEWKDILDHNDTRAADRVIGEMMAKSGLDPDDAIDRAHFQAKLLKAEDNPVDDHDAGDPAVNGVHTGRSHGVFRPSAITLNPAEKRAARLNLMDAIDQVSARYAKEAGVAPEFMARMLDSTAVTESAYGTLRSVQGTVFASSAGGAFHMLNSHVEGMVSKYRHRPEIAAQLQELGINPHGKITTEQAWTIKEKDVLAASFVALERMEVLNQKPELRGNVGLAAGLGFMVHNIGRGGYNDVMANRVNHLSPQIVLNNPKMLGGVDDRDEAVGRYVSVSVGAMNAAAELRHQLKGQASYAPATTVSAIRLPSPEPTMH